MALSDTEAKELWKQLKDGKVLTGNKPNYTPNYTPDTEPVHKPAKMSNGQVMSLWKQLKDNNIDPHEVPKTDIDPSLRTATGEDIATSAYPEFTADKEATYFGEKGASAFGPAGSLLGKIMDVLMRGQYASAELSKAYILGEEMTTDNMIKHIKGKDKLSYGNVVPLVFPEWSPWKQKAAGFVLDIFGDPTTYAPSGLPRKAWKATEKLPAVAKTVEKLGKTQAAKMFKPGAGLPKDFYESAYDAEKGLQAARHRILLEAQDLAGGLSKKDMEDLGYFREHPDKMGEMSSVLREKLDHIGTELDSMVNREVEAGLIDKETADKWLSKDIPYLPHVYPNQRLNIVSGKLPPSLFEKSKGARFGKKRHISTIEDAEELSKQFDEVANAKTAEDIDDLITKYGLEDAFGIKKNKAPSEISKKEPWEMTRDEFSTEYVFHGSPSDLSELKPGTYFSDYNYARGYAKIPGAGPGSGKIYAVKKSDISPISADKDDIFGQSEIDLGGSFRSGISHKAMKVRSFNPHKAIVEEAIINGENIPEEVLKEYPDLAKIYKPSSTSKPDPDIIRSNAKMLSRHYMPEKNAVKAYVIRKLEHENVLARDKFVNSTLEQFGEKIPADTKVVEEGYGMYMPKGALRFYRQEVADPKLLDEIDQLLQSSGGDLIDIAELERLDSKIVVGITKNVPKYKLPEEIARYMNQSSNFFMGDPQTHQFFRMFDKVQNVWKGMATAWRLPFHLRNMYSNMFQAYLSGVKNPKRFITASDIQLSFITKHNEDIQLGEKVYKAGELRTMIEDMGIHGKGWLAGDIQKPMMEELDSILRWGKMKKYNPMQLPREFGSVIEDNARIAVFVDQLAKGKTPKEAQQAVRKYLFDYTELTDFERNVMKRVIPFYCVPDYSEILTKQGWKTCYTLKDDDIVLTYNKDRDCYEWQSVDGIAIFMCDQNILSFSNKRNKLLFTHEHRWVVKTLKQRATHSYGEYNYDEKIFITEGSNLNTSHRILMLSEISNNDCESLLTTEQAELLGWLLTDGYFRWRGNHCEAVIYQHPKKYLNEVISIAGGKPRKPHPVNGTVCVPVLKERVAPLKQYLKRDKNIDNWVDVVTGLSFEALTAMYNAMMKADGHYGHKHTQFACQLKGVGDTFEVLATLIGKRIKRNDRGFYVSKNGNRVMKIADGNISEEYYCGDVWCPKTENGTWVMKQNGVITITGNTWSRKNIPLQIDSLINQPRKYQIYGKGLEAVGEPETEEEAAMKPKYFDKMMYIKTGMKSKKGDPVYMSVDLPPMEFNRMFDIQQWISSTTPAKVILEEMYNVTSFPKVGNKIENVKGELTQAPFWVGYLPKIIRDKAEKDGLIGQMINKQTGDMVVGINKKWLYGIHTALPFLNEMSRMYSMPVTLDDERPEMKRRSYMTGIGWKTLDAEKEKVNRMREGDNRMRIIKAFIEQRGEMPTKRQLDILMNN